MLEINIKFAQIHGALAHLARAFDWQSRGDEFESRMLHHPIKTSFLYNRDDWFYFIYLIIN